MLSPEKELSSVNYKVPQTTESRMKGNVEFVQKQVPPSNRVSTKDQLHHYKPEQIKIVDGVIRKKRRRKTSHESNMDKPTRANLAPLETQESEKRQKSSQRLENYSKSEKIKKVTSKIPEKRTNIFIPPLSDIVYDVLQDSHIKKPEKPSESESLPGKLETTSKLKSNLEMPDKSKENEPSHVKCDDIEKKEPSHKKLNMIKEKEASHKKLNMIKEKEPSHRKIDVFKEKESSHKKIDVTKEKESSHIKIDVIKEKESSHRKIDIIKENTHEPTIRKIDIIKENESFPRRPEKTIEKKASSRMVDRASGTDSAMVRPATSDLKRRYSEERQAMIKFPNTPEIQNEVKTATRPKIAKTETLKETHVMSQKSESSRFVSRKISEMTPTQMGATTETKDLQVNQSRLQSRAQECGLDKCEREHQKRVKEAWKRYRSPKGKGPCAKGLSEKKPCSRPDGIYEDEKCLSGFSRESLNDEDDISEHKMTLFKRYSKRYKKGQARCHPLVSNYYEKTCNYPEICHRDGCRHYLCTICFNSVAVEEPNRDLRMVLPVCLECQARIKFPPSPLSFPVTFIT